METETPKLARVSMSATYYHAMQQDLAAAVALCNHAYGLIRRDKDGSYTEISQLVDDLDGILRDIRNRIEPYISPL